MFDIVFRKANKNLFRSDKLQSFVERPTIAVHQESNKHGEASVGPIERVDQTAHRILFACLNKFIKFLELFEGLIPQFMGLISP